MTDKASEVLFTTEEVIKVGEKRKSLELEQAVSLLDDFFVAAAESNKAAGRSKKRSPRQLIFSGALGEFLGSGDAWQNLAIMEMETIAPAPPKRSKPTATIRRSLSAPVITAAQQPFLYVTSPVGCYQSAIAAAAGGRSDPLRGVAAFCCGY